MAAPVKGDELSTLRCLADRGLDVSSPQISVVVGNDSGLRTFYIHEAILSRHSEFFAAALRNDWKEANERIVHLPDDSVECFELFARFLYSGRIFSRTAGDRTTDRNGGINDAEWGRLAQCWILGEKLLSTTFKDASCDALCEKLNLGIYPRNLFTWIYPKSTPEAPIRRLLIDVSVWKWSVAEFENTQGSNDFFRDLAIRLRKVSEQERSGPPPFAKPECKYHEHEKTPCYKTMF